MKKWTFTAELEIIGINPFVFVPSNVLNAVMEQAGKDKSPIPVRGTINGIAFQQALVRYAGAWRFGETVRLAIAFDPTDRSIIPHPAWVEALAQNWHKTNRQKNVLTRFPPTNKRKLSDIFRFSRQKQALNGTLPRPLIFY